jgi:predicted RNA-binding Zn-ribbon protein involved in translation (DUF1610 family)
MSLIDARETIQNLEREIEQIKAAAKFRAENTVTRNGLTYERESNGSVATYPFCPKCLSNGTLIRLLRESNAYSAKCPNCGTQFAGEAVWYEKPDDLVRQEETMRNYNRNLPGIV